MEEQITILAVAPYEGLAATLVREARAYPNVKMSVVVGNLEEGLSAAIEQLIEPYDLILSRGGTAELLRDTLDIPVIDIKTSAYDILQAIQLSEDVQGRRAVVGFPSITDAARSTSDILQLDLEIFTLFEESDTAQISTLLAQEGYKTILCDVISSTFFREQGFNTALITSGASSVRESIEEAIRTSSHIKGARAENLLLRHIIRMHSGDTVVFYEDGRLFFTTLDRGGGTQLLSTLRRLLPQVLSNEVQTVRRSLGGRQYNIKCLTTEHAGSRLVSFYIASSKAPTGPRHAGMSFYTSEEARTEYYENPFSLTGDINAIKPLLEGASQGSRPLLISGEYGTGRTAVAEYAYLSSSRSAHPLIEIDCEMLTDKTRSFLLENKNSPLFADGQTIHLKNMETSSEVFINGLFSLLASTNATERNSLIFSCDPRGAQMSSYIFYIKDRFQCVEVALAPLRESRERIASIAKLYLSQLNAGMPKEVLRIDREAMALMNEYSWPGNYIQFKRVLAQLCIVSRDHTIRARDVRSLLAHEQPPKSASTSAEGTQLNLGRTLAEIERDIVEEVIRKNGGNQSAAARQLGISRTTLWRMLRQRGQV